MAREMKSLRRLALEPASPSTDRTLAILELLSERVRGLSVAEIVRELGISQNSVFRITNTLHARGYLHRREDDRRFVLSNRLFDLGRPQVEGKSLAICAREALKSLRDDTMETAQLLVRSGMKCVVLDQVTGLHPVKVMGEVGLRVPMFSCAPGKAILAHTGEDELAEWMSAVHLKKYTSTTLTTKAALKAELEETRKRGYAVDRAEGLEGIHCVGAAIFDGYEYPVAAIAVMAPSFRMQTFERTGLRCLEAAAAVRERLLA